MGWSYASSSSRLFRLLVSNRDCVQVFLLLTLIFLTLSLDLPWTSNVFVELTFLRLSLSSLTWLGPVFLGSFWIVLIAFLQISASKAQTAAQTTDFSLAKSSKGSLGAACLVFLGFATAKSDYGDDGLPL